jgi:hypothetical protein
MSDRTRRRSKVADLIAYDWDIDLALSAEHLDPELEDEEILWASHVEPDDDEDDEDDEDE